MEDKKIEIDKDEEKKVSIAILIKFIPKIIKEIIILLISIFIFTTNIGWLIHSITYVQTTATIYKVVYDENYKSYRPIYEYKHKNNKKYRVLGNIIGDEKNFTVGDTLSIMYSPKDYNKIDEGTKKDSAFAWVLCLLCLGISSVSVYMIIKKLKKLKQNNYNIYEYSKVNEEEQTGEENKK